MIPVLKAWHPDDLHRRHPGPAGNASVQNPPELLNLELWWWVHHAESKDDSSTRKSVEILESTSIHTHHLSKGPLK